MVRNGADGYMKKAFSESLYTEQSVPPWRKCQLLFRAERRCRVDALIPWHEFRILGNIALPVELQPGETILTRMANETGIEHMGGVEVRGVEL